MDVRIATLRPTATLVIHDAEHLAWAFFQFDPSSAHPKAYDKWVLAQQSPVNRIVAQDVTAINTTMAARSPLDKWEQFTHAVSDLHELAAIDPGWDLLTLPDDVWARQQVAQRIEALLAAVMGPWRNAAVATKVLHAKRPRLVPVLDSYVVAVLGGLPMPDAHTATKLIVLLRQQGRANLTALQALQQQLCADGYNRTLLRILDALLWLSHPGAWGSKAFQHLAAPITISLVATSPGGSAYRASVPSGQ